MLILLCSDIVVASPNAQFGLPEAQVGVYAYGGGLPRLARTVGMQMASDIALTGRRVPANEALHLGLIQGIAKSDSVVAETLENGDLKSADNGTSGSRMNPVVTMRANASSL